MSLAADLRAARRTLLLRIVAAAAGIGLVLALLVARLLSSVLFGISPADPVTLIAVGVVLGGTALLASYIPARQAAGVNPATTLRAE